MNISTKYTNKNNPESFMVPYGKIVIRNVPKGIIRALRHQSELAGDSKRTSLGSVSAEGLKAVLYYLKHEKKVNVDNIIKSCV